MKRDFGAAFGQLLSKASGAPGSTSAPPESAGTAIRTNRLPDYKGRRLLCVTHTDRPTELENCSLNYLEHRFCAPGRLPPQEPFESLAPASTKSPYLGAITLWDIGDDGLTSPRLVGHFRPGGYKPQQGIWYQDNLWVVGVEQIVIYNPYLVPVDRIQDPWLAGGHTITPGERGALLVTCAASDSVLVIDAATRTVREALRLPEALYGQNYPLRRTDSVVEHFIVNDYQLTHVNCAWPWRGGILTSSLIPGAIGWFDRERNYKELLKGFVGCHGVRVREDTDEIYFTDSCVGVVVFLNDRLAITHRIATGSCWLHDAQQITGEIFALSISDRNCIQIFNLRTRKAISEISCDEYGVGTQFLYFGQ